MIQRLPWDEIAALNRVCSMLSPDFEQKSKVWATIQYSKLGLLGLAFYFYARIPIIDCLSKDEGTRCLLLAPDKQWRRQN